MTLVYLLSVYRVSDDSCWVCQVVNTMVIPKTSTRTVRFWSTGMPYLLAEPRNRLYRPQEQQSALPPRRIQYSEHDSICTSTVSWLFEALIGNFNFYLNHMEYGAEFVVPSHSISMFRDSSEISDVLVVTLSDDLGI